MLLLRYYFHGDMIFDFQSNRRSGLRPNVVREPTEGIKTTILCRDKSRNLMNDRNVLPRDWSYKPLLDPH
jgi:hypothetical protein